MRKSRTLRMILNLIYQMERDIPNGKREYTKWKIAIPNGKM